jgi:hypothetical protein
VNPASNLPPLIESLILFYGHSKSHFGRINVNSFHALLDAGADVNTLVPLGAVPRLRRFAKLDPAGKLGVPALIVALASGFDKKDVLEKIWQQTSNLLASPIPCWLAALQHRRDDPSLFRFVLSKMDKFDPLERFTMVSTSSDLVWLRTSCLLEFLRVRNLRLLETLQNICTEELFEKHRLELVEDFRVISDRDSTIFHNLCHFPHSEKTNEQFYNFVRKILHALRGTTFVEDAGGQYPLDRWLASGRLYLEEWNLSPKLYLQLLFLPSDDAVRLAHLPILNILGGESVLRGPAFPFAQSLFDYAKSQGEQVVSDFLERIILHVYPTVLIHFLCPGTPLQAKLTIKPSSMRTPGYLSDKPSDNSVEYTLSQLRERLGVEPRLLRPALRRLFAAEMPLSLSPKIFSLFAAVGLEETKTPEFLYLAMRSAELSAMELSLLLECGCPPTHPNLLNLLTGDLSYERALILHEHGASFPEERIASFRPPTVLFHFESYTKLMVALYRTRADSAPRDFPPVGRLLHLLSADIDHEPEAEAYYMRRQALILATLSALAGAGAPVADPLRLLCLSLKQGLESKHVFNFMQRVLVGTLDTFGTWQAILECPTKSYKDFELILTCDALERKLVHFHGIDRNTTCRRLSIFDRVLQIAASKPYVPDREFVPLSVHLN